jgi:hypothetical protein
VHPGGGGPRMPDDRYDKPVAGKTAVADVFRLSNFDQKNNKSLPIEISYLMGSSILMKRTLRV